jgi:predicted kinase
MQLTCHLLIGLPASGKTTFAARLAARENAEIISTDRIRAELYGDETIQGDWNAIANQVFDRIERTIASGKSVIYDATNAQREWRSDFLQTLHQRHPDLPCIAWYLTTPLATCKAWNWRRNRQVPETVLDRMAQSLRDYPPSLAEGFTAIRTVDPTSESG